MIDLPVAPGVVLPAESLTWTAVRASGAGGQNVNKVATKVSLRFDPAQSGLSPAVRHRLARLAKGRLDAEGCVVVVSQSTRSQARNLEDARAKLAELLRAALRPPKKRVPTKPTLGAKRRRLAGKRKQADKKRSRRGEHD